MNEVVEIEKEIDLIKSRLDIQEKDVPVLKFDVEYLKEKLKDVVDRIEADRFLKKHPRGYSIELKKSGLGYDLKHGLMLVVTYVCNEKLKTYKITGLPRSEFLHAVLEEIILSPNRSLVHLCETFSQSSKHFYFMFTMKYSGDVALEQINDPVDTVTEADNILSIIGLPISNRYKKKLKNRGITSVLKKGTRCIVTPYPSYADIPED